MKYPRLLLLSAALLTLATTGCQKDEPGIDPATRGELYFKVFHSSPPNDVFEGVTVGITDSRTAALAGNFTQQTQTTDNRGSAIFRLLEPKKYYYCARALQNGVLTQTRLDSTVVTLDATSQPYLYL
jgi:hypothetical protein